MSLPRAWLAKLLEDARIKDQRVEALKTKAPQAMEQLSAAVAADVEYLNRELYLHDEVLTIFDETALRFEVRNARSEQNAYVELKLEEERLWYASAGERRESLLAQADAHGTISFFEGPKRHVP